MARYPPAAVLLVLAAAGAGLIPCAVRLAAHDRITTRVTWDREIAPIVQARCLDCNAGTRPDEIPLRTYEQARPWAAAIKEEVLTRRMPKWHAARGYGDFANDPSLSPFEIALVAAWVDGGAPETDKAAGAPLATVPRGSTHESAPPAPVVPANVRVASLACEDQPVAGRLLAVKPRLAKGESIGIAARLPDGQQPIVAWIRDYDPRAPITYWLRQPLTLPRGSRLLIEPSGSCTLEATFAR
jgi:hypothetical protein